MIDLKEKIRRLKERGMVLTTQRRAVLEALQDEDRHPSAEEIYLQLKADYPSLSLATVYTNLEALVKSGEVQKLNLAPGSFHYDPLPAPHHHFYCEKCRKLGNLEISCPVARCGEYQGNRINTVQACFYGVCASCLKAEKEEKS